MKVCNAFSDRENQDTAWWLDALHHAELNNEFSRDLMRKIEEAVLGTLNNARSSRIASRLVIGLDFEFSFFNCYNIASVMHLCLLFFLSTSLPVF